MARGRETGCCRAPERGSGLGSSGGTGPVGAAPPSPPPVLGVVTAWSPAARRCWLDAVGAVVMMMMMAASLP